MSNRLSRLFFASATNQNNTFDAFWRTYIGKAYRVPRNRLFFNKKNVYVYSIKMEKISSNVYLEMVKMAFYLLFTLNTSLQKKSVCLDKRYARKFG